MPNLQAMMILAVVAIAFTFIAWVLVEPWVRERRRERLRAPPFPPAWRAVLERRVPLYRALPSALRRRLEAHVQVFLAEKRFIGCAGFEISDEVRLVIAAQACLLILDRPAHYFPKLLQVLVYPGAFVVERLRPAPSGVLQEESRVLSGESWTHGQVILSWEDVLQGVVDPADGHNVVIHEFAHQLDQEKGYGNGAPWLGRRERYERWSRVMGEEFARLQQAAALGEPSLFRYYGATEPAEFFAVVSEVFFEQPAAMAALHPALYAELRSYYRLDPAGWAPAA
jgi:Mlc titration factor MtfA (ptsG expression regulator)